MFFAGVALGGLLAAGPSAFVGSEGRALALATASAALIGAGANAINDVFDVEIDRVNRPDRPLPAGVLSVGAARVFWGLTSGAGVGLSAWLSPLHVAIAVGSVALLYGYSARLKRTALFGNLAVAAVLGLAILYGGLAVSPAAWSVPLLGAAFAFGSTLAREVAKDIEDAVGDATGGARTLPLVAGPQIAVWVAVAAVGATLASFPLALVAGLGADFFALGLPAAGLLLAAAWALLGAPNALLRRRAGRASALLKAAMVAGILALAAARLVDGTW
ncbi:MAG: geranylgeranylglycerol-phosphate geranylgeranyltransferase [Rhodothermales bacterium]